MAVIYKLMQLSHRVDEWRTLCCSPGFVGSGF